MSCVSSVTVAHIHSMYKVVVRHHRCAQYNIIYFTWTKKGK
nr:MAG TPA: hypothetical protein [Caudoviricetes sp.]DAZ15379.1 MAG TPA: hypothetical protein [Caudoviricetes sp.]